MNKQCRNNRPYTGRGLLSPCTLRAVRSQESLFFRLEESVSIALSRGTVKYLSTGHAIQGTTQKYRGKFLAVITRMFLKRFIYMVMLAKVILFGDGRTIQGRNFKSDTVNSTTMTENESVNEDFESKVMEVNSLKDKASSNNSCGGNCNEKSPKVLRGSNNHLGASCPFGSKELCLIYSLSKIAKVQVATPNARVFDDTSKNVRNSEIDRGIEENEEMRLRFSEPTEDENLQTQKQMKLSNVHCQAVRDVFIPEVKQNIPAFACRFRNHTFILSSARFFQDRRSYFDINVNESAFKNIKVAPKISRSNEFNVVPALLILNAANNEYRIEIHESNNSDEGNVNRTREIQ